MFEINKDTLIEELEPTQLYLYNFVLENNTYLGGLLSLTSNEFEEAYRKVEVDMDGDLSDMTDYLSKEAAFLLILKDNTIEITEDNLYKYVKFAHSSYVAISLCRKGLAKYKVGLADNDWEFSIQE